MANKKLTVGEVYGTFNPLQKEALHLIVGQIIGNREVSSSQILHLENTLDSKFVSVVLKIWTLLTLPLSALLFLVTEAIALSILRFVSGAEMARWFAITLWNATKKSLLRSLKSKTLGEYIFTSEDIEL